MPGRLLFALVAAVGLVVAGTAGCFGVDAPGRQGPATPPLPTPPGEEIPMEWKLYRDEMYGFEIRYPPVYIILEEAQPQERPEREPRPLRQVRFQDRALARSETAAVELPQFSITVFDNRSRLPLEQWLEEQGRLGGAMQFEMEPYPVAGGIEGVRVSTPFLIAPREFIYLSKGVYIFELTPLGEHAERMLSTFKFTG